MKAAPFGWRETRLRYAATLNPSKSEARALAAGTEVSFLPMEAVREDGTFDLSQTRAVEDVAGGYTFFRDGDVLLAKITPCFENGKAALVGGLHSGFGFGSTEFHVLRARAGLDPRFLFYVTRSQTFMEQGTASMFGAGGQKRVPTEFLQDYRMMLPTLAEQRCIVDFLDRETARIDSLVVKQDQFLATIRERREAAFTDLLANFARHPMVRLKRLVALLAGYAFPSGAFITSGEGVRLLRGINIEPGATRWDEEVRLSEADAAEAARFSLALDDIVVGMDRPWISRGIRVARIQQSDLPSLLVQRVARLRCGPRVLPAYVEFVLQSREFLAHFEPDMTGVSVPHISDRQIGDFVLPVPPNEEQRAAIASLRRRLSQLEVLSGRCERMREHLLEHRAALITAAVTGGIAAARPLSDHGPRAAA